MGYYLSESAIFIPVINRAHFFHHKNQTVITTMHNYI